MNKRSFGMSATRSNGMTTVRSGTKTYEVVAGELSSCCEDDILIQKGMLYCRGCGEPIEESEEE